MVNRYWSLDLDKKEKQARCPRRPLKDDASWFNVIISAHNHYQAGFMMHEGGLVDQAASYPDLMYIVGAAWADADEMKRRWEADHPTRK